MERELHLGTRRLRRCPAPVPGSTWRASWPVWCAVLCRRRSARAAATRPASRGTQSSSTRGGRSSWASLRWSVVPPTGRDDFLWFIFLVPREKNLFGIRALTTRQVGFDFPLIYRSTLFDFEKILLCEKLISYCVPVHHMMIYCAWHWKGYFFPCTRQIKLQIIVGL